MTLVISSFFKEISKMAFDKVMGSTHGQDKFWICDSAILEEGGLELRFKIDFLLIGRHSPILSLEF